MLGIFKTFDDGGDDDDHGGDNDDDDDDDDDRDTLGERQKLHFGGNAVRKDANDVRSGMEIETTLIGVGRKT